MTTLAEEAMGIKHDVIVQSVYHNPKSGESYAVIMGENSFIRQPITKTQFEAISDWLRKFVTASGPTSCTFNIFAQQKEMAR
jgi:hypothetical protein